MRRYLLQLKEIGEQGAITVSIVLGYTIGALGIYIVYRILTKK